MSITRYNCGLSIIMLILLQQSKPAAMAKDAFQAFDSVVEDVATAYVPYHVTTESAGAWLDRVETMTRHGFDRIDLKADEVRQCLRTS
jgi:hypothetical protein